MTTDNYLTIPLMDLVVTPELRRGGRSVVALESTVIAHGLPWPENLELARRLEAVVREHGATPGNRCGAGRQDAGRAR